MRRDKSVTPMSGTLTMTCGDDNAKCIAKFSTESHVHYGFICFEFGTFTRGITNDL
jgi:hypothetical protein